MTSIVSRNKNFIFVHVPKTGGSSITKVLREYEASLSFKNNTRRLAKKYLPTKMRRQLLRRLLLQHVTARNLRATVLGYDRFFSFAFVRNPWDLQVSFYHHIRGDKFHRWHDEVSTMRFEEFLRLIVKRGTIGQYRYLTDRKGQLIVDFVGRYERLEEDFSYICKKIDVDFHMPHANKSQRDNYQKYYDDESREMLAKLSRKDIELFDYSF